MEASNDCTNCRYSLKNSSGEIECHRYAPRPSLDSQSMPLVTWPIVGEYTVCGEHELDPRFDPDSVSYYKREPGYRGPDRAFFQANNGPEDGAESADDAGVDGDA